MTASREPPAGRVARILIVGGYGAFGARVAERLAREAGLDIVIAGRDGARAAQEGARLRADARAELSSAALDAQRTTAAELRELAPRVVINAAGPFQGQSPTLAEACIAAGCHYVDLADARGFVTGIGALDGAAKAAGVLIVSGASSVPGLSSAVVSAHAHRFQKLTRLDIGISPGNSFDPGLATAAAVLGGVGRPIEMRIDGATRIVRGWQGARRHDFPALGRRWMGFVDVPDLALFPAHGPSLDTVRFQAGLEVPLFHLSLWGLSWLVRAGLVRHPERLARGLLAVKRRLSFLGSDRGGMFVIMGGVGADGRALRLAWHLIAGSGHGAFVPAIASAVLAKRLARGEEARRGAMPCFGLMTLDEFAAEVADLDIRMAVSEVPPHPVRQTS